MLSKTQYSALAVTVALCGYHFMPTFAVKMKGAIGLQHVPTDPTAHVLQIGFDMQSERSEEHPDAPEHEKNPKPTSTGVDAKGETLPKDALLEDGHKADDVESDLQSPLVVFGPQQSEISVAETKAEEAKSSRRSEEEDSEAPVALQEGALSAAAMRKTESDVSDYPPNITSLIDQDLVTGIDCHDYCIACFDEKNAPTGHVYFHRHRTWMEDFTATLQRTQMKTALGTNVFTFIPYWWRTLSTPAWKKKAKAATAKMENACKDKQPTQTSPWCPTMELSSKEIDEKAMVCWKDARHVDKQKLKKGSGKQKLDAVKDMFSKQTSYMRTSENFRGEDFEKYPCACYTRYKVDDWVTFMGYPALENLGCGKYSSWKVYQTGKKKAEKKGAKENCLAGQTNSFELIPFPQEFQDELQKAQQAAAILEKKIAEEKKIEEDAGSEWGWGDLLDEGGVEKEGEFEAFVEEAAATADRAPPQETQGTSVVEEVRKRHKETSVVEEVAENTYEETQPPPPTRETQSPTPV